MKNVKPRGPAVGAVLAVLGVLVATRAGVAERRSPRRRQDHKL